LGGRFRSESLACLPSESVAALPRIPHLRQVDAILAKFFRPFYQSALSAGFFIIRCIDLQAIDRL
jgi:hypothetical protein